MYLPFALLQSPFSCCDYRTTVRASHFTTKSHHTTTLHYTPVRHTPLPYTTPPYFTPHHTTLHHTTSPYSTPGCSPARHPALRPVTVVGGRYLPVVTRPPGGEHLCISTPLHPVYLPYHTIPYHTIPLWYYAIPYHTISYHTIPLGKPSNKP